MSLRFSTGLAGLFALVAAVLAQAAGPLDAPLPATPAPAETATQQAAFRRPHMGFTAFPYDLSQQAIDDTYRFIADNADLITFHLDNKVPWPEALAGDDGYDPNVIAEIDDMIANIPPGHHVYVSATPQNTNRGGELAAYWAADDGLPLPSGWTDKTLDDPEVVTAFTNWCRYLIRRFDPDYFAFAIECNAGFWGVADPAYQQFLTLVRQVSATLKTEHPALPVFLTVQTASYAAGGQAFLDLTAGLLVYSDFVGVSSYPYLVPGPEGTTTYGDPGGIPDEYLSRIAALAPGKPFAISETGYIAETLDIPELGIHQEGREAWQAAYVERLMTELQQLDARFVVWFVSRDHDLMNDTLEQLGVPLGPIWFLWRDTGLLDGDGNARPGLGVWRSWLRGRRAARRAAGRVRPGG